MKKFDLNIYKRQNMKGNKSICKIVSYIKETKTFVVQEISSPVHGFLPLTNDSLNYKEKIFNALKTESTIPLICIDVIEGKPIYSVNLHALDVKQEYNSVSISIPFSYNDESFNSSIFETMFNLLGDTIDNDIKFCIAKQLIIANKKLQIRSSLYKDIFYKCTGKYGKQLWKENLLTFTTNATISNLWKNGNDTERQQILDKLGISLPEPKIKEITKEVKVCVGSVIPLFENIAENIIKKINSANNNIKIAVAWFTNFDLFNCVKSALNRGIDITLVTNNDLINNGGYCLNFNELIESGLKLHLVEYPEMLHYKFCIIDNEIVITGSYNWTFYAEEINKEDVVIIEKLPEITSKFVCIFNSLIEQYKLVDKMPATVPDRPQYDRSSFKQYISEELVLRARKNIGDRKETLNKAKILSPENENVIRAISEFELTIDNSQRSLEEIDQDATQSAISERILNRDKLQDRQTKINKRISNFHNQRAAVEQQRESIIQEAKHQLSSAQSEEQRIEIQKRRIQKEAELDTQIEEINNNQNIAKKEIDEVNSQIQNINSEIDIINKTSTFESIGGRGSLKITLKWATKDDLDLHVFDPSNQEIYYNQKVQTCQGVVGRLDIDANANPPYIKSPVENIYWEDTAPTGNYKVIVKLYKKRDSLEIIPFTVTIYPEKGISKVFTKEISLRKENVSVVEFIYSDNGIEYFNY